MESVAFHLELESACGFLKVARTAELQPEWGKKILYFCLDSENSRVDRRQKASKSLAQSVISVQKEKSALHALSLSSIAGEGGLGCCRIDHERRKTQPWQFLKQVAD